MSKRTCCVADCKNTSRNGEIKFYCFPLMPYKLPQRLQWIEAVRRINKTPDWSPKRSDRICNVHFIGNKKSDEQMSPSYVPTLFSSKEISLRSLTKQTAAFQRHARFMKRRGEEILRKLRAKENKRRESRVKQINAAQVNHNTIYLKTEHSEQQTMPTGHQECQVETFIPCSELSKTFICNRYIYSYHGEAEIQTDINVPELGVKKECTEMECNSEENSTYR